ncbi:MAG: hypothetical protein RIT45_1665 [Pseudomonadota bacterium]
MKRASTWRWMAAAGSLALLAPAALTACNDKPSPGPDAPAAPAPPPTEAPAPEKPKTAATAPKSKATTGHPNLPGFVRPEGPVATVNGRDIQADRFNAEFDRMVGRGVRIPADRIKHIARSILARLIDEELRQQAIIRENITLTEPEFESAYKEYTSRFVDTEGRFDESQFRATLERNRLDVEELKEQIRRETLARKLVDKLGVITVEEGELRSFYDQNSSAWVEDESRDVRPILVPIGPGGREAEETARVKAEAASHALREGGDFEQIAQQYGDRPRAPIHLLRTSPETELARAAFELKVGEVSHPIRTRWGFFVVRLIEKNDSRMRPYEEVRDEIKSRIRERKVYLEGLRIVRDMRKDAEIIEKLPF